MRQPATERLVFCVLENKHKKSGFQGIHIVIEKSDLSVVLVRKRRKTG